MSENAKGKLEVDNQQWKQTRKYDTTTINPVEAIEKLIDYYAHKTGEPYQCSVDYATYVKVKAGSICPGCGRKNEHL